MESSKTILITGAAGGIGSATARLFSDRGWLVGLADMDFSGVQQLAEDLGRSAAIPIRMDVVKTDSVERGLRDFVDQSDSALNVLVNNAGVMEVGPYASMTRDQIRRTIDINLWGTENVTLSALPYLRKSSVAAIVNMASASALYGIPDLATYAATKAAIRSLTEAWDLAFRDDGIRVCDILPMFVRTNLVLSKTEVFATDPTNRIRLEPDHVANAVWKAVHGKKLHYPLGIDTRLYFFLNRLLPDTVKRRVVKRVGGYR